jgi:hypothetical protein
MRLLSSLAILLLPAFAVACTASSENASGTSESNLDTSGCSGSDYSQTAGAVSVTASRPPTASCWNVGESGLRVAYSWTQKNDSNAISTRGFYVSLNDKGKFEKADSASCEPQSEGGFGHDTSGDLYYTCTAYASFDFDHNPDMKSVAYGSDGHRADWKVQVAVALDDNGNWDSLNGANYRFDF